MMKILILIILLISLFLFGCTEKTTNTYNINEIKIIGNETIISEYNDIICSNNTAKPFLTNKTFVICKTLTDKKCIKNTYNQFCN